MKKMMAPVFVSIAALVGLIATPLDTGSAQATTQIASSRVKVLYNFKRPRTVSLTDDGIFPQATLALDAAGNLYGTTFEGGDTLDASNAAVCVPLGCGTVFKLNRAGRVTALYRFQPTAFYNDGANPTGGVVLDPQGNLYGTTALGGSTEYGIGTVFKIDSAGNETILYTFDPFSSLGAIPTSTLLRDSAGNLFGTTVGGAASTPAGTIFELDSSGNFTLLYQFTGGLDGRGPNRSRLLLDPSGNLYGLASAGGNIACNPPSGCGVVFKLSPSGTETVLHTFRGGSDGIGPIGDLIQDSSGNLYGVTQYGGAHGNGIVFRLSDTGQETILYTFHASLDGQPTAGVLLDTAGNLYGTTSFGGTYHRGSVFKLDPLGRRTELYSFSGGLDGGRPYGGLIQDANGHLFGTTVDGGSEGVGTIVEITP